MSVHFQGDFNVGFILFFSNLEREFVPDYTKDQSVHQPHSLHRPLGDSLAPLCIPIFWIFIFIKHISVTQQVDNALRHQVGFFWESCAGPQVGLKLPYGSLPTQHILWFYDPSSFSVNVVKSVWFSLQKQGPTPVSCSMEEKESRALIHS